MLPSDQSAALAHSMARFLTLCSFFSCLEFNRFMLVDKYAETDLEKHKSSDMETHRQKERRVTNISRFCAACRRFNTTSTTERSAISLSTMSEATKKVS